MCLCSCLHALEVFFWLVFVILLIVKLVLLPLRVSILFVLFFFSSRRRHTSCLSDWSSDVCSSDLKAAFRAASVEASYRLARNCSLAHACAWHEVKLASQNFESPIVGPVVNDYDFQRGVGELQQGPHCLCNYSLLVASGNQNADWECSSRVLGLRGFAVACRIPEANPRCGNEQYDTDEARQPVINKHTQSGVVGKLV